MSAPHRSNSTPSPAARSRTLVQLLLASALLLVAGCGGCGGGAGAPAGGGGGPPPPPGALTVLNLLPSNTEDASINTALYVLFNKAVSPASVTAAFSLVSVVLNSGAETPVAISRVTSLPAAAPYPGVADLDAISDGRLFIFKPDADLASSTDTGTGPTFYRIRIAAGLAAVDGGTLALEVTQDFGTGATDATPNTLPADFEVAGTSFSSGMTIYKQAAEFLMTGTFGSHMEAALLLVNIDDGGSVPGDLVPIFLPGTGISSTAVIPSPPASPAEQSYTVTLTIYDPALNGDADTFTFVYDTLPPPAPTLLVRTDAMSGAVSATSIDVDVTHPGPLSDADVQRLRVTGGFSTQTVAATMLTQTISVPLKLNQSNTLSAVTLDAAGNVSAAVPSNLVIVHDNLAPLPSSLGFTPPLIAGIENRTTTPNFILQGNYSGELALVEVINTASPAPPITSGVFGGNFNLPFSLTANALTTIEVRVSDNDQPGNVRIYGPYDVYPDTIVDPEPSVTAASDGSGACAPSGNPTCVQYDAGTPPGFRTSSSGLEVSGVVERGATVQLRPPTGFFVSAPADSSSDVFPVSGQPGPVLPLVAGTVGTITLAAVDPLGNAVSGIDDAEVVRDDTAPLLPVLNSASPTVGTCSISLGSDLGAAAVLDLSGTFSGDCESLTLDLDVEDDGANPDRTKGETLAVRVYDDGAPEETTPAAAPAPPTTVNDTLAITLPAGFEDAISTLQITSFDATQNESDPLDVVVIHRTNGDELFVPRIERITNMGGSRDGELLGFTTDGMNDVTTRPTNAPMIVIEGRTSPSATASVDVFNEARPPMGAPAQMDVPLADSATGYFVLNLAPSTLDATNSFTIRVKDAGGNPTQQEIQLDVVQDSTAPATAPSVTLTSPQGGSPGNVVVRVTPAADPAGLEQFEAAARLYSDASCTLQLPIPETCGATADEACEYLETAGVTSLDITASVGDFVGVFFRDEAGNDNSASIVCTEVIAGRRVVALTDGGTSLEYGFDVFDLDALPITADFVTLAGINRPRLLDFYGNSRLFLVDFNEGTLERNFYNYDLVTDTLDQQIDDAGALVSMDARFDRSQVAALGSDATGSAVAVGAVAGACLIDTGAFALIPFPAQSAANGYPSSVHLFPASATAPRNDWVLVLRLNGNLISLVNGDALVFDTNAGTVVVPDPPISPATEKGVTVAPFPGDAIIRSDGIYFAVAGNSAAFEDPSAVDLTIVDTSSCVGSCTAANFAPTQITLPGVNGLAAIELVPGSDTLALAVETARADGSGGALHFLTIDWATPSVTIDDTLVFAGQDLNSTLTVTADGTEALVLQAPNTSIHRVAVDTSGKTLTDMGAPLAVSPGTAFFPGPVQAEP